MNHDLLPNFAQQFAAYPPEVLDAVITIAVGLRADTTTIRETRGILRRISLALRPTARPLHIIAGEVLLNAPFTLAQLRKHRSLFVPKTHPRRHTTAHTFWRNKLSYNLRVEGHSYPKIAAFMNRDHSSICAQVKRHCETHNLPIPRGHYGS